MTQKWRGGEREGSVFGGGGEGVRTSEYLWKKTLAASWILGSLSTMHTARPLTWPFTYCRSKSIIADTRCRKEESTTRAARKRKRR